MQVPAPVMRLVTERDALASELARLRKRGTVALVPTMGALHDGHMALIQQAKACADVVVVSIYVNPRQFGEGEDFYQYPRLPEQDRQRCAEVGVDLLFAPDTLYRRGGPRVALTVSSSLASCLCGSRRPGHFDGVATVVTILLHLVAPDMALFGEKDWQQLQVIRALVADLCFPVRVIGVETQRETDGLAMSSRNLNLTAEGRRLAPRLYAALCGMRQQVAAGERCCERLVGMAGERLQEDGIVVEYLQIRRGDGLGVVDRVDDGCRVFVAVRIDGVRLIDNMALTGAG